MQRLLAALSSGEKTLGDVMTLSKRVFAPQAELIFDYIEIGDLDRDGNLTSRQIATAEAPDRARWVVRKGDVITSTVRPLRRLTAIVDAGEDGSVCSSGFAVLTPTEIPSELAFAFLRLPHVCELLDLHATASMYPAVPVSELMAMPFALPADADANAIVEGVEQGRAASRRSEQVLSEAVALVEDAVAAE